jgi:hypothetical protein
MKKRIFLLTLLIGMLLATGTLFLSCGLRKCDDGNCGKILAECENTMTVACRGLIGGNVSCSDACGR